MILGPISTPTLSCQHADVGTALEISFNLNVAGRNKQVGFLRPLHPAGVCLYGCEGGKS